MDALGYGNLLRLDVEAARARVGEIVDETACATPGGSPSTDRDGDLYIGDVGQDTLGGDRFPVAAGHRTGS